VDSHNINRVYKRGHQVATAHGAQLLSPLLIK